MAKRPDAVEQAAKARARAKGESGDAALSGEMSSTAIHIPREIHHLLRAVAYVRAQKGGGRASVSKLITELVQNQRAKLEAEVSGEQLLP